jgi:hypothetical protein
LRKKLSPTVYREKGFRFFFYSNEGMEPPHVHVVKNGNEAKMWLEPVVSVAENFGFSQKELKVILEIVNANYESFLEAYRKWHRR